jgi:hypothetical protein
MSDNESNKRPQWARSMLVQGWASVAVWMSFGLLLEGLIGYKIPSYLGDTQRRELFRLAHVHGTLLGVILIAVTLSCEYATIRLHRAVRISIRAGAVLMPVGFMLAGVSHPEGDPGLAIWLVPPGAVLVVFGVVSVALSHARTSN